MPDEQRCRVMTRQGVSFMLPESAQVVWATVKSREWLEGETITGNELFPAEWTAIRCEDVTYVQSCSEEGWVWQKQADTLHYARLLEDDPNRILADAQRRIAKALTGEDGDLPQGD